MENRQLQAERSSYVQPLPLTEAQSGLWYLQKIEPDNPILNTGQYLEILGQLDLDAFRSAFDQMAGEAQALSLRFEETPDGPVQHVDDTLRPRLDIVDLSDAPEPEQSALEAMRRDTDTPVDLAAGHLSSFRLFILGPERFFWYQRIHHLAIDGYGMVLVTNRVAELYSAQKTGATPSAGFPPFHQAVKEDAEYLASQRRETDRAFWRDYLDALPQVASLAPGRAVSAHSFRRETLTVPQDLCQRLQVLAKEYKVTWPDMLVGIVAAYCARFIEGDEIVVGVPHMGRLGSKAARLPCTLMNVLPLRVRVDEEAPLEIYLGDIARQSIRMRRHGRYRSEQMRRELGLIGGHRRLFGPMINVQPFDVAPKMSGLDVRLHILGAGAVDDITFTFRGDAIETLVFETDSNPDLYSAGDAQAHAHRLLAFIGAALDAPSLSATATASPQEAQRLLFDLNDTGHTVADVTLVKLIEDRMRQTPEACCLRFNGRTMTYGELDRHSAALAERLVELGAGRDRIVAVALPRSFELVIALVGVLRAGAAYMPLDLEHPPARIERIMQSSQPVCVLARDDAAQLFDASLTRLGPDEWPQEVSGILLPEASTSDMAYVIYTSGSTGEPKGVVIEHRAIVNRLEWMRSHYGFDAQDRILQKTPATFDVSVWEFFLPLICGATLVIAPPGAHRDPQAIATLIRAEAVTTLHFVPSMLSAFLASPSAAGLTLARVFCSGEELTADQRDRFHRMIRAELHNLYGPTEAAVDVSYWEAGADDTTSPVPIGFPVWNTRLYVLDARMRPLPVGVVGELWLGGIQLARGYLGRDDLTTERFMPDPFRQGERIYRTGDIARVDDDGAVVFLGRSDHQVKVRGLRIELGEIEAAVMASGLARQAGVIAREDRPGEKRIVAYIVAEKTYEEDELRRRLATGLPDYMVPAAIVALDHLPVTSNGKLDRAALPAPDFVDTGVRPATTPVEIVLAGLFAEILGLPAPASADADFFMLGGDSLLAVNLMLWVQEEFGRDPGLGALFEHPVLGDLAAVIEAESLSTDDGLGPVIRLAAGATDAPPLFVIHPAGGISWGYRDLARALGPTRAIYGLQAPTLNNAHLAPDSLEKLAADYVERICAIQPNGPFHLAGWSVGGIIAQAMAAILRDAGNEVGLLALLDSYPAECWRSEATPDESAALRALLAIAGHDPDAHTDLVTRDEIVDFLRKGNSALGNLPPAALDGVVRSVLDVNRLVRGHVHRRFDGTLTHVRAALDHAGTDLAPGLWRAHAAQIDVVDVPFLHAHLTSPEASAMIAPELEKRLAAHDRQQETTDEILRT